MHNRLLGESSPYLLQHAHNPVDWYPWGDEAFGKARSENKPVLVSIGYAACHWCHVMEHESFENETVAGFMNTHFVNIKVDREEHPDVDHLYMDALQAMNGAGGWPLNMFVTPERKPFYGGTYFPPEPMYGRTSWMQLLQAISDVWQNKPEEVRLQSEQMIAHLQQASVVSLASSKERTIEAGHVDTIAANLLKQADSTWGGFGNAPKFPGTESIRFLLEYYHLHKGNPQAEAALEHALLSLDKMIEGGIYDQLGGGFSRYATDREWLVPHFEKMLYDNALLVSALSTAYRITGKASYRRVITETIRFCNRELRHPDGGGYYCALDADSEGVEGKFYTWSWNDWRAVAGDLHPAVEAYFGVSEEGNWEETNILHIAQSETEICNRFQLDQQEWEALLHTAKETLFNVRSARVRPGTDDKVLLSWNALMNIALTDAGTALQEPIYTEEATRHMDWMLRHFTTGEEALGHVYKNGLKNIPGKLDDYAFLIQAQLRLASAGGNASLVTDAAHWLGIVNRHFLCEDHTFYYYSSGLQRDIPVRKVELYDGATPSANAVMMENLEMLGNLLEQSSWLEQSHAMLLAQLDTAVRYPSSFARWALHLQRVWKGWHQLVICGAEALRRLSEWQHLFHPEVFVLAASSPAAVPVLEGKWKEGKTLLYLCRDFSCGLPAETTQALETILNGE